MRQEHAGLPHGHGAPQHTVRVRIRRHHHARPLPGARRQYSGRVRGGRRPLPRLHVGRRPGRAGARGLPRRGIVRGPLHRQHHVRRHRGHGHGPSRRRLHTRRRPAQARGVPAVRRGRPPYAGDGHHTQGHPHAQGLRERHRCRGCDGRLHECRPAPARHQPRGGGRPGHRRLRLHQSEHPLHRRHAPRRQIRHGGPRPGGRPGTGDEATCWTPA